MKLFKSIAGKTAIAGLALLFPLMAGAQAPATAPNSTPPQAKAAHKKGHGTKAAQKPAGTAASTPAAAPAGAGAESKAVARRDPFQSLLNARTESTANLPPGKAGLVIGSIRVDGAIKSQTGMIAVVSNPQQRVYFVREGDRLYDGEVEKINLDEVIFRESTKDAFGKPVEREVTKRLYASAGEQQ
ncbi:MAG TPA: pilus assembly protein PilP [Candidatus Acidoferrales bacterium]|nr:pilus assembly protein PilP [Candidatus Acidoferrales bacterium]